MLCGMCVIVQMLAQVHRRQICACLHMHILEPGLAGGKVTAESAEIDWQTGVGNNSGIV